ncbi:MAG: hypothetical protein EAZ30_17685 [Betaproteobacteria bacterium]|nr:MAG: hypothetical protein EAZ30_17685 [Betaproteobacteria bacterium]
MTTPQATTALVKAFAFEDQLFRAVQKGVGVSDTLDEWFVVKDVCDCLGIKNYRDAISRLDADEKGVQTLDTLGGQQEMAIISESGVYTLMLRSNGATTPGTRTHRFRKFVTAEVLPALRRTGSYAMPMAAHPDALNAKVDQCLVLVSNLGPQIVQLVAVVTALSAQTKDVLTLAGQMFSAMPRMLEAAKPAARMGNGRKKMYVEDLGRINDLAAKGYLLQDLVADTGFSQSQCYAVMTQRYKVLDSGRVSIDCRSDLGRRSGQGAARSW